MRNLMVFEYKKKQQPSPRSPCLEFMKNGVVIFGTTGNLRRLCLDVCPCLHDQRTKGSSCPQQLIGHLTWATCHEKPVPTRPMGFRLEPDALSALGTAETVELG
ncbi:hypothetical protein ElyMa_003642100 [Elysia marginata]|uniref:Uncharacterized protein n=1 Tax=Elysia marginata TaxID=1093978 RepID=A0AAV4EUZ6_9GAST|nr:hypothetical protein ElyMa_003642100 [Elysia marginata]